MTDAEELDWIARNNALISESDEKALDKKVNDAIGRAAVDALNKDTFMAELSTRAQAEFEREQKRLEMFPELVAKLDHLYRWPLSSISQQLSHEIFDLLERARKLLP